jgi:hypothetical protein
LVKSEELADRVVGFVWIEGFAVFLGIEGDEFINEGFGYFHEVSLPHHEPLSRGQQ